MALYLDHPARLHLAKSQRMVTTAPAMVSLVMVHAVVVVAAAVEAVGVDVVGTAGRGFLCS